MRPGSDAIGGGTRLPSTPHSTSMPVDELLDEHLLVVAARERDRRLELRLVVHLRDADRRAEPRRLHEHGIAERVLDRVAEPDRVVARDGDAAVAQHLLEQVLVHRERGRRDAGADVRDAGELEQALHRPVLAERPVQDRQHDVDARRAPRASRRPRGPAASRHGRVRGSDTSCACCPVELPAAVAADRDAHDLVALGIERLEHGARGERARSRARSSGRPRAARRGAGGSRGRRRRVRVVVRRDELADGERDHRLRRLLRAALRRLREHDAVGGSGRSRAGRRRCR